MSTEMVTFSPFYSNRESETTSSNAFMLTEGFISLQKSHY